MRQLLCGLLTLTWAIGAAPAARSAHPRPDLFQQVIVVDAGHGGRDYGAQVTGLDEKDLVLSISRQTARALRNAGACVVETRSADTNLVHPGPKPCNLQRKNLEARVTLAERSDAGIFLSIHANKFSDPSAHGAQVFVGENPDAERQLLGTCLHSELTTLSGSRRELNTTRDLYLMRNLKIPAALIEVGFISNPAERARMLQPRYQRELAQGITRGVVCFVRGRSALRLRRSATLPPAHVPASNG